MVRLKAPLRNFEPGQYRQDHATAYDFEVAGVQFQAFFTYDALELELTTHDDIYILLFLLGNVQDGILLRAKGGMYERAGRISVCYTDGGFKELSFWESFRVSIEIV
ncbi:hypothetical protein ACJZ2D_015684 [Fusarium nematophilum]